MLRVQLVEESGMRVYGPIPLSIDLRVGDIFTLEDGRQFEVCAKPREFKVNYPYQGGTEWIVSYCVRPCDKPPIQSDNNAVKVALLDRPPAIAPRGGKHRRK